jgi:DNA polymerase III delta prime subunit
MNSIPWVEKYRPQFFDEIILDKCNKRILDNMIKNNHIPNLLLHGPPGTGKTTTIINLIRTYQKKNNQQSKGLVIHLNASDERGIDTIRNQIKQFADSKYFFEKGVKFIILDEVDYMTKTAQNALCYLLQQHTNTDVRFCLICNYISRLNLSLKNTFICLRFNQLPSKDIRSFLTTIVEKENLKLDDSIISDIQSLYGSDIRSMINYIQGNQNLKRDFTFIVNPTIFNDLENMFCKNKDTKDLTKQIKKISLKYQVDVKTMFKLLVRYMARHKVHLISSKFLDDICTMFHVEHIETEFFLQYMIVIFKELFTDKTNV